uniref:ORF III n=1 Tax=Brevibacterium linens TaxID=1703 RepID=Q9F4V7_BRELN|nr:DNA-binding protein [Brevibacterium linens]AAF89087.1 ORF III [Brevibacterium linens]
MTDDQSPEARAEAAARDLADTGRTVTARAIREAAKVRMAVASAAAKAWNDAASEDDHETIPPVPDDVASRLTVIWADAYRAALAAVTPERDQLRVDVDALRVEVEGLTADVETVEAERDTAAAQVEDLKQELAAAQAETEKWSTEAAKHEAALSAVRDQHDKLNERITTLLETQAKREN